MYVLSIVVCPFGPFLLTIVLSVLRYTVSDCPFGIFKLFFKLQFVDTFLFYYMGGWVASLRSTKHITFHTSRSVHHRSVLPSVLTSILRLPTAESQTCSISPRLSVLLLTMCPIYWSQTDIVLQCLKHTDLTKCNVV